MQDWISQYLISRYLQEAPELWASLGDSPASVQDLHPAVVHLLITFVSLLQDRDGKKYLYRETTSNVCCRIFLLLLNLNFWLYDVIAGVLDTRDGQHEEQRDSGGEPGQRGHRRDGLSEMAAWFKGRGGGQAGQSGWRLYLEDQQQQEVDVCQPPELLQQVERQEGEQVVPGGLDGIVLDQRSGRVKWGKVSSGEVRWGYVRSGEVKWGQVRYGKVRWSEVRWSKAQVRWGQFISSIVHHLHTYSMSPQQVKGSVVGSQVSFLWKHRGTFNVEQLKTFFFPFLFFTTRPRASASYLPGPAFRTCTMTANPFRLRGTTTLPPLPTTRHRRLTTQSQQRGWKLRGKKNKQTNKTQECVSINPLDKRRVDRENWAISTQHQGWRSLVHTLLSPALNQQEISVLIFSLQINHNWKKQTHTHQPEEVIPLDCLTFICSTKQPCRLPLQLLILSADFDSSESGREWNYKPRQN